ncbi:hypothetical protein JQ621_00085 [Bradyrhizobium manausense]|uniref:hypothetical protein n=1 Tax=Bradyrhizobium manausense TaxID=989370 RepID=UPI001BABF8B1|nr:hypothetical protein [Bradyrhizobium manausense]MBR1085871.1 hypothetical protein [Bradyrhizobium manausense]
MRLLSTLSNMILAIIQFMAMFLALMSCTLTGAVVSATWARWRGNPLPTVNWRQFTAVGMSFWLGIVLAIYLAVGFYNVIFGSAWEP